MRKKPITFIREKQPIERGLMLTLSEKELLFDAVLEYRRKMKINAGLATSYPYKEAIEKLLEKIRNTLTRGF